MCSTPNSHSEQGLCDLFGNVQERLLDDETLDAVREGRRSPQSDGSAECQEAGCEQSSVSFVIGSNYRQPCCAESLGRQESFPRAYYGVRVVREASPWRVYRVDKH